jgi:hypothetical protein
MTATNPAPPHLEAAMVITKIEQRRQLRMSMETRFSLFYAKDLTWRRTKANLAFTLWKEFAVD